MTPSSINHVEAPFKTPNRKFDEGINRCDKERLPNALQSYIITQFAHDLSEEMICKHPNWFTKAKAKLMSLLKLWNATFKLYLHDRTNKTHKKLLHTRSTLQKEKQRAKCNWQFQFVSKCQREDFKSSPKNTWSMIFELTKGFNNHRWPYTPKNFADLNGKIARNNKENTTILSNLYQKIFNHDAPFDPNVINEIKQHDPVKPKIGEPLTIKEITSAINWMKNN